MATKIDGAAALKIRNKLGQNQKDFWAPLGVTQSGGSRYESGRNMPAPVRKLMHLVHVARVVSADSKELARA
jgi:DNA-binding transcriptional regulator YiaG